MTDDRELKAGYGWAIVIGGCAVIVCWGLTTYFIVRDQPRQWDMGQLPDVPSQSVYSTESPSGRQAAPRQFAPLPEARPPSADGGAAGNSAARPAGMNR